MRVGIVGGTGQIGIATASHLVKMGVETFLISRSKPAISPHMVAWMPADIADEQSLVRALKEIGPQRVVNLAALLQFACDEDPSAAVRVNVGGALNVLEACRQCAVDRIIFGSSIAVYGERSDRMSEDDAIPADLSLYGSTKLMGEALGKRYEINHGLRFLALRYSGVFGGQEAATSGMSAVRSKIQQSASGVDVLIHGASGSESIHLTHVVDAAEATCVALLSPNPKYSTYNVAGPNQNYMRLRDFHAALKAAVPGCGNVIWNGKARSAGPVDISRLQTDLNFSPRIGVTSELLRELTSNAQKEKYETCH